VLLAASNPQALWYLTRGFGLVALGLLTVSVALGVAQIARYARPGLPRFLIAGIHRNVSLLATVVLVVHIITAVADPFAPIGLIDAFIPFAGPYRPLWLGLGALAGDMLLALVVTSLIRQWIGPRAWRAIHWCAYACWPVAVIHGLGTGTDTRMGWVQLIYVGCLAMVLAALAWRLTTRWSAAPAGRRLAAAAGAVVLVAVASTWAAHGPLERGWAKKAGTPSSLLGGGPHHRSSADTGR
jgi:sulfoxide reductase heme-binding subunit YedZ